MDSSRTLHPHWSGAPARMADGRLFTDYRGNCTTLAPLSNDTWADFNRKQRMVKAGGAQMIADRRVAFVKAASVDCVDTMVPETAKRVYTWNSATVIPTSAGSVGIGTGTMYLPGQPDLASADPDVLAMATYPVVPGSIKPMTVSIPTGSPPAVTGRPRNRYAAPYGN